jgi:hypothetical protein
MLGFVVCTPARAWDFQATVNGNGIVASFTGLTGNSDCCVSVAIDDPAFSGGGACSIPCPFGGTRTLSPVTCNAVGTHVVYGCVSDSTTGGVYQCRTQTVTVIDPPSPSCPQFDVIVRGGKALTHKYGDSFSSVYPNGQTTDGEMPVVLRTIAAPAGTAVYLKIIDPPDASLYGAPHNAPDNIDTSAGTFSGGGNTTTMSLPATGTVSTVLRTTSFAAGDNYQIQASADSRLLSDPTFTCTPSSGCRTTSIVTAWKRMYVEYDDMYRFSQLLALRTLINDIVVYTNDGGFRRGDAVRLVHAPSFTRTEPVDVDGFYSEDRTVADIARNRNAAIPARYAITLDRALQRPYFVDATFLTTQLGDAIVNLSRYPGRSPDPAFHASDQYVANAFADAFVEVVKLPANGVGVPLYSSMTENDMRYVATKWWAAKDSASYPSNAGICIAAEDRVPLPPDSSGNPVLSLGTTGTSASYIWRLSIDDATQPNSRFLVKRLDPEIVAAETVVHELAHQWAVNATSTGGHCNKTFYNDPTKYCTMNSGQNNPQLGDGVVRFHYVGTSPATADSEYMDMRRASEPKP